MNDSLERVMRDAMRTFKRGVRSQTDKSDAETAGWLSDNYYMLERMAAEAAQECRQAEKFLKGSDLLPSLFARCVEMCKNGTLPDEKEIVEFFAGDGLDGVSSGYLQLAVVCALIDIAAEEVRSSGKKRLANVIGSLRRISETDFDSVTEKLCASEKFLLSDPAGIYPSMDAESKRYYRYRIALSALKKGKTEKEIAETALKNAAKKNEHIGKYIISSTKNTRRGRLYLAMEIIMPFTASLAAGFFFAEPIVAVMLFVPLWELLRHPIESASMRGILPRRFLRLGADDERVKNVHVLLTVSTILPSTDRMHELESRLEELYLSNAVGNIKVCCLADFKAAGMPRKPEDKHVLKAAEQFIDRLNKKHGSGFILAVRPRSYSDTQNEFIGKERKRGAITELVRAIKGNSKGFCSLYGDTESLEKVKYLITLDWDTRLVFDSARELVAIAEHPLYKPEIKEGRVVSGYGILVPKTEIRADNETVFSHLLSGDSGITAYDSFTGERYQDLFGESIFCGKGLINVDAYYEVLDKTLPRETVLSHDIIESGYLRAGFVPDVQITESFPQTIGSYFQRLHRWIRGDWQNIGFIFGKNPMNRLSRYKIFDNLRRSLTPALCLSAIFGSMVIQGYEGVTVAVLAAFALCSRNLFSGLNALLNGGFSSVSRLYYSKALSPALDAFVRAFISVALSARESFVSVDAAVKAMWRLFVSGDKLLEWVTAAQSERQKNSGGLMISCIPAIAASSILLIFGLPIHRLIGLILLADIPITLFSGAKMNHREPKISEKQRETLMSYASSMWGFFDEQCGRENNFLPPDNIQFSPSRAVARRTSPTNIGLMLASFLAARDLGLITAQELYVRLNLSLATVEKLEKHEGNLLNWYATDTLEPLHPRFVSTVDSGNFLCCLVAVKQGLREYLAECPAFGEIIGRIEKIIAETDLKPLFNERRKLFYIGIDSISGEKSSSCYDLYMSEIRMTSYFAVARKAVSKKHWGAMARIPVAQGRYTGLASWTGTMFEYFMPNIFIPAPHGSLTSEALLFCLQSQRKRAGKRPFGISESGFYAFDGNLNYQYKAHGVQKLGLSGGLDWETVVSPYSTFLTLTTAPQISLKNLSRLESMGVSGKYGFFEAVDFTRKENGDFSVVRSYMAHHVGMSLLSVDNLLNKQCMQSRFMSDGFMQGAKSLLDEKATSGAKVFKDVRKQEVPKIRERVQRKNTVSENPNPFSPKAAVYSNGRMTSCITDIGTSVSLFDGVGVTVDSCDPIANPRGVFAVFAGEKEIIPFVRAVDKGSNAEFKARFLKDCTEHRAEKSGVSLLMQTKLLRQNNCELRSFTVENTGRKSDLSGRLIIYFDPCLEKKTAYSAHPAFSKLFLTDEWDEENRCLLFSRRSRDTDIPCALAAGFLEEVEAGHESSREKVLTTPDGVFSLGEKKDFSGGRGNPDCCCAFMIDIKLSPEEKASYTLAVAVEETKEQALNTLLVVRAEKKQKKLSQSMFFGDALENAVAGKVLPRVLFPRLMSPCRAVGQKCNFNKEDLWSFGVSGDNPILLIKISQEDDVTAVAPYLKINKLLRNCGIATDLVVAYSGEEGYTAPIASAVKKLMQAEDCGLMLGVKGGVHLADFSAHGYEQCSALEESAAFMFEQGKSVSESTGESFKPLKFISSLNTDKKKKSKKLVKQHNFTDSVISVKKQPVTVDIPWNIVLANRSFGTMVSDKALGFTWAINSRENKLTPWYNDTMADNRGELLILKYDNILYDIISIGKAEFTPEKATWTAVIGEVEFAVTVTVPQKGMTKKCSVEINNKSKKIRSFDLMYYALPVLGSGRDNCSSFFAQKSEDCVVLESSWSDSPGFMSLKCDKSDYFCLSRRDFFEGHFNSTCETVSDDCCLAAGRKFSLAAGGKTSVDFFLSWAATEEAASAMPKVVKFGGRMLNPLQIDTKDNALNLFFNSFLYSQIKQSRFFGKTGFYQCSGAYGFRDQLQDCLAFIDSEPQLAFTHIVRCAAVQFEQGDVLHWWHVNVDGGQKIRGIRTRCSDDMLWLPYACMTYFEKTGDSRIFEVNAPYLTGDLLKEYERERYFTPGRTQHKENLLKHCIKAIDFSLKFGNNNLPLIGSCDWNDGFSRIGGAQSGESVWLAMFQKMILKRFSAVCAEFGMRDKANEYIIIADKIENAVLTVAWEGDRFSRAFLENGEKLGKDKDFIDILPQAFASFAEIGSREMISKALDTAFDRLFDSESGVVRLLSPSFDESEKESIGYIASYPEGIRENGGQYTHAAVWLTMAMFKEGKTEQAMRLVSAINPLVKYSEQNKAARYRAEPFVLAGDVSYGKDISGRAGWTHFTGSAAWFYRCIAENIKKIRKYYSESDRIGSKGDTLYKN